MRELDKRLFNIQPKCFCNIGRSGLSVFAAYLVERPSDLEQSTTQDDGALSLNGLGYVYPVCAWNHLHIGYAFDLPRRLTTIDRHIIRISRNTDSELKLDPKVQVLFADSLICIVASKRNNLVTIVPNAPTVLVEERI